MEPVPDEDPARESGLLCSAPMSAASPHNNPTSWAVNSTFTGLRDFDAMLLTILTYPSRPSTKQLL